MRYSDIVKFVKEEEFYNRDSGEYSVGNIVQTERYADITDTGTEAMNLLYGKVIQGSKTIRIKAKVTEDFDYVLIDKTIYLVKMIRTLMQEQVMHLVVKQ
ncbi:hypothetical protein [Peptoniphilus raoultii]|uniref:hypothetical protein n=1 Tax=Peptoniphilus raoultii TaxID=1776387 RepID=UPI0008DAF1EF|nr:hypothetical protein [Peptoniphilus raoultii]